MNRRGVLSETVYNSIGNTIVSIAAFIYIFLNEEKNNLNNNVDALFFKLYFLTLRSKGIELKLFFSVLQYN